VSQGLGNQMFQYALGEIIRADYGVDVSYDASFIADNISGRKMRCITEIFEYDFKIADIKEVRQVSGKLLFEIPGILKVLKQDEKLYHTVNYFLWKHRLKKCILIQEPDYWNVDEEFVKYIKAYSFNPEKNYYMNGFWESIDYISEKRDYLRNVFKFKINNEIKSLGDSINQNRKSVSVHLRRGDYVTKSGSYINFNICDEPYYKNSISIVKQRIIEPEFFVFSDDIEYAKKVFANQEKVTYMIGHKDYEDMYLMSKCKHNIIANSTFSFWGAFLNQNKCTITISPCVQYEFRKEKNNAWYPHNMPVLSDWIVIKNDMDT